MEAKSFNSSIDKPKSGSAMYAHRMGNWWLFRGDLKKLLLCADENGPVSHGWSGRHRIRQFVFR